MSAPKDDPWDREWSPDEFEMEKAKEQAFDEKAAALLGILTDLDEFDRPKVKLPNCPRCDEDELGVIHADLLLCYRCGWKIEGKMMT